VHINITPRETEILELAAKGYPDKQIAIHLNLSQGTIRTYWTRVRVKTAAKSRSEAIARVLQGRIAVLEERVQELERQITPCP
jgi:DNA-binding CsgD family transcriptional regulator